MNFTQYIAIRAILDCEIETNPSNEVLPKVVSVLLDSDDKEYEKFREPVSIVVASASGGIVGGALLDFYQHLFRCRGLVLLGA